MIIFLAFLNFILRKLLGRGFSIAKLHNYVWLFTFSVYLLNPFGYYDISIIVIVYSFIYILVFNITFLVMKRRKSLSVFDLEKIQSDIDKLHVKTYILILLSALSWLFSFQRLVTVFNIILTRGMSALRTLVYYGDIYTTVEKLAYQYFIQPLFMITIIIGVEMIVFSENHKKNAVMIGVALTNAVVYSMLFGGRALLLIILLYMIYALLIRNCGNLLRLIMQNRKVLALFLVLVVLIGVYASMRVNRQWGIIGEFVIYVTGSLGYLSRVLELDLIQPFSLFGRGLLGGVFDTFGLAVRVFGYKIELTSQIYSDVVTDFIVIGDGISTNYTATIMTTFLMEAGVFGLVYGAIFFGAFCSIVEDRFIGNNNLLNLSIYIYVTNMAFESIQNYTLKSVVVVFVLIYMVLFFNPYKIIIGRRKNEKNHE